LEDNEIIGTGKRHINGKTIEAQKRELLCIVNNVSEELTCLRGLPKRPAEVSVPSAIRGTGKNGSKGTNP
jgi:hypothetical protein